MTEIVNTTDRARMVELWASRLRSTTDFEAGYYTGRFEEYASQNAIDPETFPGIQDEALASTVVTVVANCPQCGGEPVLLGQLGQRLHFRCRHCGIGFSHLKEES